MTSKDVPTRSPSPASTGGDRHPSLARVLQRIVAEAEGIDGPVERLEVFCHASGDATYRWWPPRADESEGGYLEQV